MIYEILDEQGEVINRITATPEFMAANYSAEQYREVPGAEFQPQQPVWAWYIDQGPFTDRLGAAATRLIDTSTAPGFVAIRADFARRRWIDLKDQRVIATVNYLAGQPMPGLGTLAQPLLTTQQANEVLTKPVTAEENLALRRLYFSQK